MESKKIGNTLLSVDLCHVRGFYTLLVREYFNFDDSPSLEHMWGEQYSKRLVIEKGRMNRNKIEKYSQLLNKFIAEVNENLSNFDNIHADLIVVFNRVFNKNIHLGAES